MRHVDCRWGVTSPRDVFLLVQVGTGVHSLERMTSFDVAGRGFFHFEAFMKGRRSPSEISCRGDNSLWSRCCLNQSPTDAAISPEFREGDNDDEGGSGRRRWRRARTNGSRRNKSLYVHTQCTPLHPWPTRCSTRSFLFRLLRELDSCRFLRLPVVVDDQTEGPSTVRRLHGDAVVQIVRTIGDIADDCGENAQ